MTDADVQIAIGAKLDELNSGIREAKGVLDDFGSQLKSLAALAGVAFTAEGVKSFVTSMAELGQQTQDTAAILGVSTEYVGQLRIMAETTGASVGEMGMALTRLSLNLGRAETGTNTASFALKALGLNAQQLIALPTDQRLGAIADALSKLADGAGKSEAIMVLLGRGFQGLLPFLDQGKAGLQAFADIQERTGTAISPQLAAAMADTNMKIIELGQSVEGIGIKAFEALEPTINTVLDDLTKLFEGINPDQIATAMAEIGETALDIIKVVGDFAIGIAAEIGAASGALKNFKGEAKAISEGAIGGATAGALGGPLGVAGGAVVGGIVGSLLWGPDGEQGAEADVNKFKTSFDSAMADIKATLDAIGTHNVAQTVTPEAPDVNKPNVIDLEAIMQQQQLQAQADQFAVDKSKAMFEQLSAQYSADAANYAISQQQKTALLEAALQKEYSDEVAALQKKAALYPPESVEYAKIQDQILLLTTTTNTKILEQQQALVTQLKQQWTQWVDVVGSQFNTLFADMLHGINDWNAEFQKLVQNLLIGFEQLIEKALVLATVEEIVASITGVPLAGGFSGAFTKALGIPSFDVGAYSLPQDTLAMVHKGEMILPPGLADMVRGGGMGGGGVHVHFTNNGGGMSDAEIMRHSDTIAQAVRQEMRNFNRSLR